MVGTGGDVRVGCVDVGTPIVDGIYRDWGRDEIVVFYAGWMHACIWREGVMDLRAW